MSDNGRGDDSTATQLGAILCGVLAIAAVAKLWGSQIKPWASGHLSTLRSGDLAAPVLGSVSWADVLGVGAIMVPVLAAGLWAHHSLKARRVSS